MKYTFMPRLSHQLLKRLKPSKPSPAKGLPLSTTMPVKVFHGQGINSRAVLQEKITLKVDGPNQI
jgi:hypothetical protein